METLDKIIKDKELNIYQKKKEMWLRDYVNNGCLSENTKIAYWRFFNSHVLELEENYRKDLMHFTSVEIINTIKSSVLNSISAKRALYAAINNYLVYCTSIGEIFYNPCDTIDTVKENLFAVNKRVLQKAYMELDEFYKYVDSLEANPIEKMLYILVRYGCPVQYTRKVKWEDINAEDLTINVMVKDKYVSLPIDEEFIKRVENAHRY